MLFLCARCKTRYKVADEKVKGRVLKIRCRQCSALIVLRDNQQPPASDAAVKAPARPEQPAVTENATQAAEASATAGIQWHVAIGREKKGPISAADVVALIRNGSLNGRSYVWRRGFESWQHLESIGEFSAALESPVIPAIDAPTLPNLPPADSDADAATVAMPGPSMWPKAEAEAAQEQPKRETIEDLDLPKRMNEEADWSDEEHTIADLNVPTFNDADYRKSATEELEPETEELSSEILITAPSAPLPPPPPPKRRPAPELEKNIVTTPEPEATEGATIEQATSFKIETAFQPAMETSASEPAPPIVEQSTAIVEDKSNLITESPSTLAQNAADEQQHIIEADSGLIVSGTPSDSSEAAYDEHEEAFFETESGFFSVHRPVSDQELEALPDLPDDEESFFEAQENVETAPLKGRDPALKILSRPSRQEIEGLVQEFSLIIRLNKRDRRKRTLIAGTVVFAIAAISTLTWYANEQRLQRKNAQQQRAKTMPEYVAPADESAPTYSTASFDKKTEKPPRAETQNRVKKTNRETLDLTRLNVGAGTKKKPRSADNLAANKTQKKNSTQRSGSKIQRRVKTSSNGVNGKTINKQEFAKLTRDKKGKSEFKLNMNLLTAKKTRKLENKVVSNVIRRRMRAFQRCVRSGGRSEIRLKFTVNTSGSVSGIRVSMPGGADRAVQNCVRGIASKWQFPPIPKSQTFTRTLVL